jgi:hypothetical protein
VYVDENGKISQDIEINPIELKTLFTFELNELKPNTVFTVTNKSGMDARGYLCIAPGLEEGTPQFAFPNSTTGWTVSTFALDLATHNVLNLLNTSETKILSLTAEYTP